MHLVQSLAIDVEFHEIHSLDIDTAFFISGYLVFIMDLYSNRNILFSFSSYYLYFVVSVVFAQFVLHVVLVCTGTLYTVN